MPDLQHPYGSDLTSFSGVTFDGRMTNFDNGPEEGRMTTSSGYDSPVVISEENTFSLADDLLVPDVDFPMDEVSHDQPSSHFDTNKRGNSASGPNKPSGAEHILEIAADEQQPRRDVDSHCVLACTEIISNLENYVLAELKALDLCLAIVRQTVDELSRLVETQQGSRNFRCMALFSVIMYQIIELLESGCAAFLIEGESEPTNGVPGWLRNGSTPGRGFGAFRMGAREQRAWRTEIVLKDLQQGSEVLEKIITLARLGPRQTCRGTSEERAACYIELERRFAALRERLSEQR